ncbi:MAG: translation initiation factor [Bacteroidales bacterium]|nr:translation initiation factor [Bacteroidales bacterium]
MAKDWKDRLGVVYSTNPDFQYKKEQGDEDETPGPSKQNLRVYKENKGRKGKTVTLVKGFVGTEDDLKELGRMLKTKCGVGGSVKDSEILIQGEFVDRVKKILSEEGYRVK